MRCDGRDEREKGRNERKGKGWGERGGNEREKGRNETEGKERKEMRGKRMRKKDERGLAGIPDVREGGLLPLATLLFNPPIGPPLSPPLLI